MEDVEEVEGQTWTSDASLTCAGTCRHGAGEASGIERTHANPTIDCLNPFTTNHSISTQHFSSTYHLAFLAEPIPRVRTDRVDRKSERSKLSIGISSHGGPIPLVGRV